MNIRNRSSNEDLLCCRVCLMTDCRLFNIHQYELSEAFSRISGTPVYKDQLFQYLCTYCSTLLLKCTSFRDMCLRTEQCLKLELLKGELNTDSIRRIDRPFQRLNLTLSVVQIVDCIENTPIDIKNESNDAIDIDDPTINTDIKSQVNIETDESTLCESNIDNKDEDNLGELTIDDIDESNLDESNIDETNENTVGIDCGIQNDDTETELVENHKVKIKGNEVEDKLSVNKVETYKKMITSTLRKMGIKIQEYSDKDKVNDNIKKHGPETNLDTTSNDKTKINISYTDLESADINEDIYAADINAVDEVEAQTDIVDVDTTVKKAVKKKNIDTYTRKIGTTAKSKDNCDDADTLERAEEEVKRGRWTLKGEDTLETPVKRRRLRKERKIKFRNPANDNLPVFDFSKFESDYGVEIVTLSKQEQLEEIALRKQSTNYLGSQFRCEECGKGYAMEAAYNNHRRRHSPSAGEYACEICSARFKLECIRHRHQDMHRLKFVCNQCGLAARTRSGARTHHELHKGKSYDCQYCEKRFFKRSTFLSHVRLLHPTMNVVCGDCGETFVSEKGLKMHKTKMHSENMFKCTACSASFVSIDALKVHTGSDQHSGNSCEQCGESCASEEALQTHVRERHPSEAHRCEECRATFSSAAAFDIHVRRKHLNQRYSGAGAGLRSRKKREGAPRGQFVCEQCGYIAESTKVLQYHQNNHLAVKPFACSQCPKTFPSKSAKTKHEWCHKGEKPFKCPKCPLALTTRANFKRHHRVVHLGEHDRAACHACGHVFTAKASLVVHIRTVHNGQPGPKRDRKRKKLASY